MTFSAVRPHVRPARFASAVIRAIVQTMSAPPLLFDRALVRRHRARAARGGPAHFLHDRVADELADRVSLVKREFSRGFELGGGGFLNLSGGLPSVEWLASSDLSSQMLWRVRPAIELDEERLPLADGALDLLVSPLALHWTNDLPGALIQIRRALKPDGLFIGAMFGGATLTELRASLLEAEAELRGGAAQRVSPFADLRDLAGLLQRAGFALPVADTDVLTVRYDHPFRLLMDLRRMGETAAFLDRSGGPLTKGVLMRAMEIYQERHALADGRVPATFEILYASGWAPAPSQPQPLRPGSARTRLADALGVTEQNAGEKTGGKS